MDNGGSAGFQDGPFIFRINENGTGPGLLIQVCLERGWRGYRSDEAESWNLWWRAALPSTHRRALHPWQFINHIPKGSSICKKDNLARHLKCMKKVYGAIYDFSPPGFHLPLEYAKLAAECSKGRSKSYNPRGEDPDENSELGLREQQIWISKPVGQSQGRGIYLFRRLSDLTYDSNSVVQRYIERPLLIGGYKFDLRLYVCIPTYHPLTVYLYKEGLARFSTDKFSLTDLHNPFRHLTNSSLNKFGPKYAECKDRIGSGCKWTLRQLRRHLHGLRLPDWGLWQRIAALVVLTALAQAAGVPPAQNCFEFFGFDVLVDADLRPWLLEVNLSPALANDCDADTMVKKPLLHDLFDLLGLPMRHTGLSLFTIWSKDTSKENSASGSCSEEEEAESPVESLSALRAAARWRNRRKPEVRSRRTLGMPHPLSGATTPVRNKTAAGVVRERQPSKQAQGRSLPAITLSFPTSNKIPGDNTHCQRPLAEESSYSRFSTPPAPARKDRRARRPHTSRQPAALLWGNGRDWSNAPGEAGGWIKLFPTQILHKTSIGDMRACVGSVARYSKAARAVERRLPEADDQELMDAMREELQADLQIWLPEK